MAKHPPPLLIIFFVWGKIPFSLFWLPLNSIHHHDNRTEKKMIALPECEKTEETLMTSWYPAVTAVFNDKTITKVLPKHQLIITIMTKSKGLKGERLRSFYSCVSALLSIQVSNTFPLYWRWIFFFVSALLWRIQISIPQFLVRFPNPLTTILAVWERLSVIT